jgi:hypothetical protein
MRFTGAIVRADLFEFHNGFWINLHHVLYRQALLSEQTGAHDLSMTQADRDELRQLSDTERATWSKAVSYYRVSVVQRDLLFDDDLIRTKDQLEDAETSPDPRRSSRRDPRSRRLTRRIKEMRPWRFSFMKHRTA